MIATELAESFDEAQKIMIADMQRYRQSSDPYRRIDIMRARGVHETMAGRIFNAFAVYCSKAGTFDGEWGTSFAKDAKRELYRNPQLTLAVLLPILKETTEPEADGLKWHGLARFDIFRLVLNFALIEEEESASLLLKEWSQKTDDREIRETYDYYQKNHLRVISEHYKTEKDYSSLYKLGTYALLSLPSGGCRREWIKKYLGAPDFVDDDNRYFYQCHDDAEPLVVQFGPDGIILRISGFHLDEDADFGQDIRIGS